MLELYTCRPGQGQGQETCFVLLGQRLFGHHCRAIVILLFTPQISMLTLAPSPIHSIDVQRFHNQKTIALASLMYFSMCISLWHSLQHTMYLSCFLRPEGQEGWHGGCAQRRVYVSLHPGHSAPQLHAGTHMHIVHLMLVSDLQDNKNRAWWHTAVHV